MSGVAQLYQESILEHHKQPRNAGRLEEPTHLAEGNNPLCGDRVTVTLRIEAAVVLAVRCEALGCAICRASGSMMTEAVTGCGVPDVLGFSERFMAALATGAAASGRLPSAGLEDEDFGALGALLDVRQFPGRLRCATLAWEILRRALGST